MASPRCRRARARRWGRHAGALAWPCPCSPATPLASTRASCCTSSSWATCRCCARAASAGTRPWRRPSQTACCAWLSMVSRLSSSSTARRATRQRVASTPSARGAGPLPRRASPPAAYRLQRSSRGVRANVGPRAAGLGDASRGRPVRDCRADGGGRAARLPRPLRLHGLHHVDRQRPHRARLPPRHLRMGLAKDDG